MQLGFALRQKKISIEVIEEVLSDLFLSREAETEISKEALGTESQPVVEAEHESPRALAAGPKIPRIFDEPWASNTPIESSCLGTLPLREGRNDSPEEVGQSQSAVQAPTSDPRNEESQSPVTSPVRFPYTFAMGCVPRPAQASREVQTVPPIQLEQSGAAGSAQPYGMDGVALGGRELKQVAGAGIDSTRSVRQLRVSNSVSAKLALSQMDLSNPKTPAAVKKDRQGTFSKISDREWA